MISQKIRTNASISYFFLGWLFLLAKNNPNFADPYIKAHAKNATKGHVIFFTSYFFYGYFLSGFFSYSLPVIQITVDHLIQVGFFTLLTFFIIYGVQQSQKGEAEDTKKSGGNIFSVEGRTFYIKGASEAQRIILVLSHIPFVGMVVSKRYPNIVTMLGARWSSLYACIYILSFIHGGFDSLSTILLFIGILGILFLAVRFMTQDECYISAYYEKIPSINSLYVAVRSLPGYFVNIGHVAFGKKDTISWAENMKNIQEKDKTFHTTLQEFFADDTLPFPSYLIFVPFCNIIFLPKLLRTRNTRYILAIGQGLIITLLAIGIGIFSTFTSSVALLLLFPIVYGIASLESDVFIRIPIVYEVYSIINTLTFGLLSNSKRIRAVQKQDMAVSYKME